MKLRKPKSRSHEDYIKAPPLSRDEIHKQVQEELEITSSTHESIQNTLAKHS